MSEIFDTPGQDLEHEELCQLIPWFVNGTLAECEHRRVQEHLVNCLVCRSDLKLHRDVARVVVEEDVDSESLSYNLARLTQRIAAAPDSQAPEEEVKVSSSLLFRISPFGRPVRPTAMAMVAGFTLVAAGLSAYWQANDQSNPYTSQEYRTLSSPGSVSAASQGELFIAFERGIADAAMLDLFLEHGLEPVSRSEDQRLWRVRLLAGDSAYEEVSLAVDSLRANESVLFVERVISEQ
jgi:hypothetical protein